MSDPLGCLSARAVNENQAPSGENAAVSAFSTPRSEASAMIEAADGAGVTFGTIDGVAVGFGVVVWGVVAIEAVGELVAGACDPVSAVVDGDEGAGVVG